MLLTRREIIFLTSVSHGRTPIGAGIVLEPEEKKSEYANETISILQNKNILDKEKKLTEDGVFLLTMWQRYRNSKKHMVINETIFLAIAGEQKVLQLIQIDKEHYEFSILDAATVMLPLLQEYTFLRDENDLERSRWEDIDVDIWKDKAQKMSQSILISEYIDGKKVSDKVYCVCEEKTYLINVTNMRIKNLSGGAMRKQIYEILGE